MADLHTYVYGKRRVVHSVSSNSPETQNSRTIFWKSYAGLVRKVSQYAVHHRYRVVVAASDNICLYKTYISTFSS